MIKEYIEAKYGFKVYNAHIAGGGARVKFAMYDAPNAFEKLKLLRKHPTSKKVEVLKDALKYFAVI